MNKDKDRVRNWKAYNQGLINRGRINLWIDQKVIEAWKPRDQATRRGRPQEYSDSAILICVVIRKLYHLSLRGCKGFMISIFELMNLGLKVPDYSSVSRRSATLEVELGRLPKKGQIDIAVDATGLKVYGEGEWKVRKHGWTKHRRWMKLHLAIDLDTQQIVMADLTSNGVDDAKGCERMIFSDSGKTAKIRSLTGDMAYDKKRLRQKLYKAGIRQIIPPISRAVKSNGQEPYLAGRDKALRYIGKYGKDKWKRKVGYHKRSLAETAVLRYKTIIGPYLTARKPYNQRAEAMAGIMILNKMMGLAKPISYKAA